MHCKKQQVIIIAHHLKTVVNADQILVLEEEEITERGMHLQLLSQNELYSRLWNLQNEAHEMNFTN